jgi:hypothetical protein
VILGDPLAAEQTGVAGVACSGVDLHLPTPVPAVRGAQCAVFSVPQ